MTRCRKTVRLIANNTHLNNHWKTNPAPSGNVLGGRPVL